jgi:carbamoyltransferase
MQWPTEPCSTIDHLPARATEVEIRAELERAGLIAREPANLIAARSRGRIHAGEVIGRLTAAWSSGPRARQPHDLYHARAAVNQWLNKRLGRTEFMLFAPVIGKRAKAAVGLEGAWSTLLKFMTMTFDCTEWMKKTARRGARGRNRASVADPS